MRIEIFANGAGAVSQLESGLNTLHSNISATIDDLRAITRKMNDLPGGVENLSGAYQNVNSRIRIEEARLVTVERVSNLSDMFLSNTVSVDSRVARLVNQNRESFFETHPWLRPVVSEEKSWWEQRIEDWNNFWSAAGEMLKETLDGIINWVKEHAVELIIGAVAIVVGAVLTAITGGAFLAAVGVGLKAAAISALISGAISATVAAITGDDVLESFGDGLANGFMWGGIFHAIGSIFTAVKNVATSIKAKNVKTYPLDVLDDLSSPNATDSAVEHIFNGSVRRSNGYHYNMIDGSEGKIIEGTKKMYAKGVYKAKVEFSGIPKSGHNSFSTFFPDSMSPKQVMSAIDEAYLNRVPVIKNVWEGTSKSGMKITMYLTKSGKYFDAFPVEKTSIIQILDSVVSKITASTYTPLFSGITASVHTTFENRNNE